MLFEKLEGGDVRCLACRWYCQIREGQAGVCGVRFNERGRLALSVYGRPCAIWADPIEKKPLFHFLPGSKAFSIGTFGCNFACDFCQNWDISQAPRRMRAEDPEGWKGYYQRLVERCEPLSPKEAVRKARESGCSSIAFTYNEPTIFTEYAIDVMRLARKEGIKGVYVTNGYESKECWDAIAGLIDAVNIDLKAFTDRFYKELCHVPGVGPIKESIAYAKKKGFWVEVTTLVIPGRNDSDGELSDAARFLASIDKDMPWHVSAFHPDYLMGNEPSTSAQALIKARKIGLHAGLRHVYAGNLPPAYADMGSTICPTCDEIIVERRGFSVTSGSLDGICAKCGTQVSGIWR